MTSPIAGLPVPQEGGFPEWTLDTQVALTQPAGYTPSGPSGLLVPDGAGFLSSPNPALWTPAQIPNLWAWFDVSDPDNVTVSGTDVTQLSDKSGNGRHATTGGIPPNLFQIQRGVVNGLDCMFGSANPWMGFSPLTTNNPISMVFIGRPGFISRTGPVWFGPSGTTAGTFGMDLSVVPNRLVFEIQSPRFLLPTTVNSQVPIKPNFGTTQAALVTAGYAGCWVMIHDDTITEPNAKLRGFQNGILIGQTSAGVAPVGLSFGQIGYGSPTTTNNCFNGMWCEGFLVAGRMSLLDVARVSNYARHKWGAQ